MADPFRAYEQQRQNERRRERYHSDPEYRAARLAYNRPYVAASNAMRSTTRAGRRRTGEAA